MATHSLPKGLYDLLMTEDIKHQLEHSSLQSHTERLLSDDSHRRLADEMTEKLSQILAQIPQQGGDEKLQRQVALFNELLVTARKYLPEASHHHRGEVLPDYPHRLLALDESNRQPELPSMALSQPWLFIAGYDTS